LSIHRLQKEEALKARVVKADETGEKEKVLFLPLLFVILVCKREKKTLMVAAYFGMFIS